MSIKKFNISVPKRYTKDGEEKTAWANVGKLVYFPKTETKEAGFALELFMFPETKFMVFEEKPKDEQSPF
jgi:hypothetical protein